MEMEKQPRAFYPDYVEHAPQPARTPGWNLETERRMDDGRSLARALGWFSIGLGVVELLAPHKVTDFLGIDERHTSLVRFYGLREIASGVGILTQRDPVAGVWSRVAGDMVDLASLGTAMAGDEAHRARLLAAMGMVAGVAALDLKAAGQLHETTHSPRQL